MKCPHCFKSFDEVYAVHTNSKEPFTGVNPMEGLAAYGAYQAEKELLCHVGDYVHFRFLNDGEERLVHMVKYDPEALAEKHEAYWNHPMPCEHANCHEDGIPCYINWIDEEPNGWYCTEHAYENGFCSNCGIFQAGIESFDFFNPAGLCASCKDQLETEDDYDDDEYNGWDYYPEYEDIIEGEEGGRYIGEGSEFAAGDDEESGR